MLVKLFNMESIGFHWGAMRVHLWLSPRFWQFGRHAPSNEMRRLLRFNAQPIGTSYWLGPIELRVATSPTSF